jgi:hypothetical protein
MGTRQIVYMDLGGLEVATRNPKDHDLPGIIASLTRYGWTSPAELDERTGKLVVGHGRREACIMIRQMGDPPPGGVLIDDDGEWLVPVLRGWASRNDEEAEAYIIAHNKLSEAGGWFDRMTAEMLEDIVTTDASLLETTGFDYESLDVLLRKVDPETIGEQDPDKPVKPKSTPDPDPHMPLATENETVEVCEACEAGRLCLKHSTGVHTADDLARATKTYDRNHTCPNCGHDFED